MELNIRQEKESDFAIVFALIEAAFQAVPFSDHQEHFLVQRLRKSTAFIPELSLVAECGNKIVGHILLTRLTIKGQEREFQSLALAPVSVLPIFQRKGVGARLIKRAHEIARKLGHKSIILIGHEDYYPRFGYSRADRFDISPPFEVPPQNFMAVELVPNGLANVCGLVEYPKEFSEA